MQFYETSKRKIHTACNTTITYELKTNKQRNTDTSQKKQVKIHSTKMMKHLHTTVSSVLVMKQVMNDDYERGYE